MTTSKFDSVTLRVQGEPMSEVFLVDGGMRRIASGIGSLTTDVAPGIYKIRSRMGGEQSDRLVEISGAEAEQREQAPSIEISSSAPIYGTATSHEYQAIPARDLSLRLHTQVGRGSRLFVYIRDPEIGDNLNWTLPAQSVSILDLEGNHLCDLEAGDSDPQAGYRGLNVELDPGTWRLRVETEPLGSYEIFVTTVSGWQTQVFLVMDDFPHGDQTIRRPSLKDAVVMMAEIHRGFNPHGEDQRLVSLARTALAHNRPLMSGETMARLVHGKFEDPLFGIYALGLLLLEKKPHGHDTSEILGNLRKLLGPDHPDLMALHLAFDPETARIKGPVSRPPLLYQSWQQLVRFSRDNNRIIPGDSLLSRLAENFMVVRPWLLHRIPNTGVEDRSKDPVSLAAAKRTLANLIQLSASDLNLTIFPDLSGLEAQIIRRLDDQAEMNRLFAEGEESVPDEATQANQIFSRLNAPGYSIANAVERIASRLDVPMS